MHPRTQASIAVGTALLAAAIIPVTVLPALAVPTPASPTTEPPPRQGAPGPPARKHAVRPGGITPDGTVSAAALLARAGECDQISKGLYRARDDTPADIPVCDAKGAVFFKADMDVDCDGEITERCNLDADPYFQNSTAYTQSDGRPLNAEKLPYIVVPTPSGIWNYRSSGIRGGSVAAVIHGNKVEYAVVGDVGPPGIIGEASYATARALGITADPAGGGVPSGVTYIVFKDAKVPVLEDHDATVRLGDEMARKFVREN
ncbi:MULTISPECIES: glycoside hydrolase family 75 protein [unclassified Streptomyces]|uniref:glycoside hydrolase family 75 protein n=1 Tax=unclassified Streptomyces TaxID=2593676 RepID=UPI002E2B9055|nr:glycoside hydrolase family 75 protein [Streptomyces sp. NBC_01429]